MKKNMFFLFVFALIVSACEGPEGPQGIPGRDGDTLEWYYINQTVISGDWVYVDDEDGSNAFYEYRADLPEMDDDIYKYGLISVYMYTFADPKDWHYGYFPVGDVYPIENSDGSESWTEYYSYLVYEGSIIFTARCSDFDRVIEERWSPPTKSFRIVLVI